MKYLWQTVLGSWSSEMWRFTVNWMRTNASWENAASFFSAACKRHPLSTLHTTASSEGSFICKSLLLSLSGTPSVISSPFTPKCYNWQYTVTPAVFALPQEPADCTIYVNFGLEDRSSILHRSADMFVLWPNIPCQACLESWTEMYLKESSINHVCRRRFEWQSSTTTLISRRRSAVAHNCMTSQGRLL